MQILYSWVKPLLYFVIFMTMVENILSESSFRKYIRVFSGMMLILVILMPLKTMFPEAWKDIYKEGESLEAAEKIELHHCIGVLPSQENFLFDQFRIGLATPCSTVLQIALCLACFCRLNRKMKNQTLQIAGNGENR